MPLLYARARRKWRCCFRPRIFYEPLEVDTEGRHRMDPPPRYHSSPTSARTLTFCIQNKSRGHAEGLQTTCRADKFALRPRRQRRARSRRQNIRANGGNVSTDRIASRETRPRHQGGKNRVRLPRMGRGNISHTAEPPSLSKAARRSANTSDPAKPPSLKPNSAKAASSPSASNTATAIRVARCRLSRHNTAAQSTRLCCSRKHRWKNWPAFRRLRR